MTAAEVHVDMREPEIVVRLLMTTDRAIDDYLGDLARRGYSQRTLHTYRRILDQFSERLPLETDVAKIDTDDVRRFLQTKQRLARGTVAHAESTLSGFFKWLYGERKIPRNPMDRLPRTKRVPSEDLDVVTVSPEDIRRLLMHADTWAEKLAVAVLVYLGPRRHAVALLRVSDYDRARGRIRFKEKGGKVIWKPVPDELDQLIEAAMAAGVYDDSDYLIPPEGSLSRKGERDDRVIWRLVKRVADRAGVHAHVHALRSAFAVFYLEQHGDLVALQALLGHKQLATTQVYLRKLSREKHMETVRTLNWGVTMGVAAPDTVLAGKPLELAKDR